MQQSRSLDATMSIQSIVHLCKDLHLGLGLGLELGDHLPRMALVFGDPTPYEGVSVTKVALELGQG